MVTILFPGRHHILTKFQHEYLSNLVKSGVNGRKVERIVFTITSANHENTRRNPIPLYLRVLAIDKFSKELNVEVKIYPILDIKQSEKFADYILSQIFYQSGEKLIPKNTLLACSTPPVIKLFRKLGFDNLQVELIDEKKGNYQTKRPFEVIEMLAKSGKNWREGDWKEYAHESSKEVYAEYNLGDLIVELFSDSLLNENADITETRDYNTYAYQMDKNVGFKFNDIKPFVVEGKIVDAGCGTGSLIKAMAKEFQESDIIGIEATRKFYEYCKTQEYANPFVFFYRKNILDQNFKDNTINTFIYSSILHEIYSYISEKKLIELLKHTYNQLTHQGRIIIRDVVGPENGRQEVYLELNENDGKSSGNIKELSTSTKFFKFAKDFKQRKIKFKIEKVNYKDYVKLSLNDAYEFISKMNYVDNWDSEMHESFSFWSFSEWEKVLEKIGFKIVEGSKSFQSQYIIDKMYKGKAILYKKVGKNIEKIDYPPTNMILAAEKI